MDSLTQNHSSTGALPQPCLYLVCFQLSSQMSIICHKQESMVFLSLCASRNTVPQCVAKTGPWMRLGGRGGLMKGLPALAGWEMLTLGIHPSYIHSTWAVPNHCHHTRSAVAGVRVPQDASMERWTLLLLNSIFRQEKLGAKRAGFGSAVWQGYGDTSHCWRWTHTQPRHGTSYSVVALAGGGSSISDKVGAVGASSGPGGCSHTGEHPLLLLTSREGAWVFGTGDNDS